MTTPAASPHQQKCWVQHVDGETLVHLRGDNPCGVDVKDGMLNLRWEIEIHVERLDSRGFVLDNRDVMRYMDEMHVIEISCEMLGEQIVCHFYNLLEEQCAGCCTSVRCRIWGGKRAWLEFAWPPHVRTR